MVVGSAPGGVYAFIARLARGINLCFSGNILHDLFYAQAITPDCTYPST